MRTLIALTTLLGLVSFNSTVLANDFRGDNYWIIGFDQISLDGPANFGPLQTEDLNPISSTFAFGHRFNRWLSAEANMSWAQISRKMPSDKTVAALGGVEYTLDSAQGVSLRFDYPVVSKLSGFAQVSYNIVHFEVNGLPNIHDSGVGYSAGLEFDLFSGAVFVRYASLLDNENKAIDDAGAPTGEDYSIEGLSAVGLGYKVELEF